MYTEVMIIEWMYQGESLSQRNLYEQNLTESTNWKKINVFKKVHFSICSWEWVHVYYYAEIFTNRTVLVTCFRYCHFILYEIKTNVSTAAEH